MKGVTGRFLDIDIEEAVRVARKAAEAAMSSFSARTSLGSVWKQSSLT